MGRDSVTLADVARLAGVSQSAVSRTFTAGGSVSEKTRSRVMAAAEQLGYRPNPMARAMITGKSRIIGLVVSYLENQFYPVALEHLSLSLQERGYHILIFLADPQGEKVPDMVRSLLDYGVDGIITASVTMSNDLTTRCEEAGIPIVMFNRGQDDPRLSAVTSDNRAGGRAAANFLVAGGHRRLAHIAGWQKSSTGRDRAQGFSEALTDHGMEPVAVVDGKYSAETVRWLTRELFDQKDRPDAVFVGNDHMAMSVMDVLRFELGLRVPEDVSVVGYDDVPAAAAPTYDLTTVRQPVRRMVEATVTALLNRVEGETEASQIHIPGDLIIRGSARKPKVYEPAGRTDTHQVSSDT
ncbi:LacI family DNA-binding transcriptional regulator [Ruegeria sp. MALMAid1280]|uniref:LacI family DNA-binding transcriptional regulator n=1 Tax=Ruegeria sp. MALMAid1280 TaxID=3411634 RepID=UPI003B9DD261